MGTAGLLAPVRGQAGPDTPSPTLSSTPTAVPSETPSASPTSTPTAVPSETPSATPTPTITPTAAPSESATPKPTSTPLPVKNGSDGLPLADPSKAVRILAALETRWGRGRVGCFLDPAFLLTAADARGAATWKPVKALPPNDLKGLEALFAAEGMRLEATGLQLTARSLRGYQRSLGTSKLPGPLPFPALSDWDTWRKQSLQGILEAQQKGLLPPAAKPEQLLADVEAGYPDPVVLDRVDPQGCSSSTTIPNAECFGPESLTFKVHPDQQGKSEVTALRQEWGGLLKTLADAPFVHSLLQDPAVLISLGVLDYPPGEDATSSTALTSRRDCWSFQPAFEESHSPALVYRPADTAHAAVILAQIVPISAKYAAMLSETRAVLALAGLAGRTRLCLAAPREVDARDLDKVNQALLAEGLSLRPALDFAQSGELYLSNPSAAQTLSSQALGHIPDPTLKAYDCKSGWGGFEDWYSARNPDGSAPRADRNKILEGLPAICCDIQTVFSPAVDSFPLIPIPQGQERNPALVAWFHRTDEALRAIYASPQWTQLLALADFQKAREERFQLLPQQLEMLERARSQRKRP